MRRNGERSEDDDNNDDDDNEDGDDTNDDEDGDGDNDDDDDAKPGQAKVCSMQGVAIFDLQRWHEVVEVVSHCDHHLYLYK